MLNRGRGTRGWGRTRTRGNDLGGGLLTQVNHTELKSLGRQTVDTIFTTVGLNFFFFFFIDAVLVSLSQITDRGRTRSNVMVSVHCL